MELSGSGGGRCIFCGCFQVAAQQTKKNKDGPICGQQSDRPLSQTPRHIDGTRHHLGEGVASCSESTICCGCLTAPGENAAPNVKIFYEFTRRSFPSNMHLLASKHIYTLQGDMKL